MMKKLLKPCLAVSLMSLAAGAQEAAAPAVPAVPAVPAAPAAPAKPVQNADQLLAFLPDVVATYGDKKVTAAEVKELVKPRLQQAIQLGGQTIPEKEIKDGVAAMVKQMVDFGILIDLAEKDGVKADPVAAKAEFEKALQANPMLEQMLTAQGMTKEKVIDQAAREMALNKWVETKITPTVKPNDDDVKKFYNDNAAKFEKPETRKISHILVKTEKEDSAEKKATAKKKCEDLLAKVKAGGDFAALAKENSDCPSGKRDGGSLGDCANDGSLIKEFTDVAFKLEKGKNSDVVETEFGYHIIKVNDITPAGKTALDKAKDDIVRELSGPKINAAVMQKLEEAKKTVTVKINI
jgi:parvulin-like peptidyl-prolyl isomerase